MRITTQTTIEMDYDEFDGLVHEHFPARKDYEFLVVNEMGADDVWTSEVTPMTAQERQDIEEWAPKGVFPAGRVVITTY